MDMLKELISRFLPENFLEYFDMINVTDFKEEGAKRGILTIELDEKNILPSGFSSEDYESKGFYPGVKFQDFPIRGNEVYLLIRRRRWRHKTEKNEIKNDYSFIADSSKITQELSDFLKGTHRVERRYDE